LTCPRCGWSLSHHWTATLLEEAARADIAQRHLVDALRRLRNLPGNVFLRPHIVLRNLFEEVGWHKDLTADTTRCKKNYPNYASCSPPGSCSTPTSAGPASPPSDSANRRLVQGTHGRVGAGALPTTRHRSENDNDSQQDAGRDVRVPPDAAMSPAAGSERIKQEEPCF
jgi:hypothetical protein